MGTRIILGIVAVTFALPGSCLAEEKGDADVRKAVKSFVAAIKAEDINAIMKHVDVPWYHEGEKVIRDRKELKEVIEAILDEKDFSGIQVTISDILVYGDVINDIDANDRELLKDVLGKKDRIVVLDIKIGGKNEAAKIGVRLRDGKVVGVSE